MSFRETLNSATALREVVEPCLTELVRPGELDAVRLEWRTIQRPDTSDHPARPQSGWGVRPGLPEMVDELRLVPTLSFGGEDFQFHVAAEGYLPSAGDGQLSEVQDALYQSLQDFIAESPSVGWGTRRG